jgi:hypothetical protein
MKKVIIESPFAGDVVRNTAYLRQCIKHSLELGEAPFASHGLYTLEGILDDTDKKERQLGMTAGWEWLSVADFVAVYTDFGISWGMRAGMIKADAAGVPIIFRSILGGVK